MILAGFTVVVNDSIPCSILAGLTMTGDVSIPHLTLADCMVEVDDSSNCTLLVSPCQKMFQFPVKYFQVHLWSGKAWLNSLSDNTCTYAVDDSTSFQTFAADPALTESI